LKMVMTCGVFEMECPKCGSEDFDVLPVDDGITWVTIIKCFCLKCKKRWYF
jgi:hypothetical protein